MTAATQTVRRRHPNHPLNDLQPVTRTGGALECGECHRPILRDHVYYVAAEDVDGSHPFCWLCGVSVKLHLGQITADEFFLLRQFGPIAPPQNQRCISPPG